MPSNSSLYQNYVLRLNQLCSLEQAELFPQCLFVLSSNRYLIKRSTVAYRQHWQNFFGGDLSRLDFEENKTVQNLLQPSLFSSENFIEVEILTKATDLESCLKVISNAPRQSYYFCVGVDAKISRTLKSKSTLKALDSLRVEVLHAHDAQADELPLFTKQVAQRFGIQLEPRAIDKIIDCCDRQMDMIESEIKKCALTYPQTKISLAQVEALLPQEEQSNVFELSNRLLALDISGAFALLQKYLDQGESALALLGIMARHLRVLRRLKQEGEGQVRINSGAPLRMPHSILRSYKSLAAKTTWSMILAAEKQCLDSDIALKSTKAHPWLELTKVVDQFNTQSN